MAGDTAIAVSVLGAGVTVSVAEPLTPFNVAVTLAEPAATPVTRPVGLTVATVVLLTDQVATEDTLPVVLSE